MSAAAACFKLATRAGSIRTGAVAISLMPSTISQSPTVWTGTGQRSGVYTSLVLNKGFAPPEEMTRALAEDAQRLGQLAEH